MSKLRNLAVRTLFGSGGRRLYRFCRDLSGRLVLPYAPRLHNAVFVDLKLRARRLYYRNLREATLAAAGRDAARLYETGRSAGGFQPLVSVIVPNYRHERYLRQRLDSIYGQSYQNIEVILLDDASGDGSVDILAEYARRYPERTRCCFNETNSGGVFHQWRRGIEMAKGELVWIAESDDFCDLNFLEKLVPPFANEAVMFSYARSVFVDSDGTSQVWSIEEYLGDIDRALWSADFVMSAHQLVNRAWAIKNIVPNVSSAVFRHPGCHPLFDDPVWQAMRICGDWVLYLHLIRGGLVAYTPQTWNYYRIHQNNSSAATYSREVYYEEHEAVGKTLATLYRLEDGVLERQRDAVKTHWQVYRPDGSAEDFARCYDLARIRGHAAGRKPNLMMAGLALVSGGGETFPIKLANLLHAAGYAVTYFNCRYHDTEPGVRAMLAPGIPVVELDSLERLAAVVDDLGIEIVHSHHAWVDATLCSLLQDSPAVRLVVTTHGMYELLAEEEFGNVFPLLRQRVDRLVYIADKNLAPFDFSLIERERFVKIGNALEVSPIEPVSRASVGLPEHAFVACLVSRAIPEKGWREAIEAVGMARRISGRDIHLALVGDGPECEALKGEGLPEHVHVLGFQANVRGHFAMADIGLLPSRFKGESAPLVLIECLYAGRPFVASDVGEVAAMLAGEDGMAGAVFALDDGAIPVERMARLIADYAADPARYAASARQVASAARKFDPRDMVAAYDRVYMDLVAHRPVVVGAIDGVVIT